jgi:hypothetical protein
LFVAGADGGTIDTLPPLGGGDGGGGGGEITELLPLFPEDEGLTEFEGRFRPVCNPPLTMSLFWILALTLSQILFSCLIFIEEMASRTVLSP